MYITTDIRYTRKYQTFNQKIRMAECMMDFHAWWLVTRAWTRGLYTKGFRGARLAAAGLE